MKAANSAGRLLFGSMPWTRNPVTTSGLATASATATLSWSTMAAGGPAGAHTPNPAPRLFWGKPGPGLGGRAGRGGRARAPADGERPHRARLDEGHHAGDR